MAQQLHIAVVDDEADVREALEVFLTSRGYVVTTADSGAALRQIMAERPADLVLLDLNMPGEDGLTLARYLRQETSAAIIMLTGSADVVDRVVGLEVGADDYIGKPFDLREVLARVRSVLRRAAAAGQPAPAPAAPKAGEIRIGRFTLNLSSRRLFAEDGSQVPLTGMEFDLLKALATHPNKVLNRDQIIDLAHGRDWDPFDRSIDVRILRSAARSRATRSGRASFARSAASATCSRRKASEPSASVPPPGLRRRRGGPRRRRTASRCRDARPGRGTR